MTAEWLIIPILKCTCCLSLDSLLHNVFVSTSIKTGVIEVPMLGDCYEKCIDIHKLVRTALGLKCALYNHLLKILGYNFRNYNYLTILTYKNENFMWLNPVNV